MLNEKQFQKLNELIAEIEKEIEKCESARAYLAGCILIGAALESLLLAVVDIYPDEVKNAIAEINKQEKKKIKFKPLSWGLGLLIEIAIKCNWFPYKGTQGPEEGEIGDWLTKYVKELRDFVHPGRVLRYYIDISIRKEHFESARHLYDVAKQYLRDKIAEDLSKIMHNFDF